MSVGANRWHLAALATLAALAPFNIKLSAEPWTDLQLRPLVIASLVLCVVLLIAVGRGDAAVTGFDRVDAVVGLWFVAVWASALISEDAVLGAAGAARLSVPMLLVPLTRRVVRSRHDATRILQALAVGSVIATVVGLVYWVAGSRLDPTAIFVGRVTNLGPFERLTRPWAHANIAALALGATIAATAALRNRVVIGMAAAVLTVAMVLTVSRGGLLAMTFAALTWALLRPPLRRHLGIVGLAAIAGLAFVSSDAWSTRVDQVGDEAFFASTIEVPTSFTVGGSDDDLVPVIVENQSSTTWPATGDERVLISARWFGDDGQIWSEDWWQLPQDLAPGQAQTTGLTVEPRLPVGSYDVRWDLVIPRTAYFGQFLGDEPIMSTARITRSDVQPDQFLRYELVERAIQLDRLDGWRLAWDDFVSSPLLGVGPNQFADAAARDLDAESTKVGSHAHNLVLEPLATWGLLGAVPFLGLFFGAVARSLGQAWRLRGLEITIVATGLVAATVHGVVDWPFVVITTGIPLGLLMGLAWTDFES